MKLIDKKCWRCKGVKSQPCPTCHGAGCPKRANLAEQRTGKCRMCLGAGRVMCIECGGVGVLPAPVSQNWRVRT